MTENIFTLAVWTRELVNSLPPELDMDDDRLFRELVDPNRQEIEAFFAAMTSSQADAFGKVCLDVLSTSDIPDALSALDEARGAVATLPRQQLSEVAETFAVVGAAAFAIVFVCRIRRTKLSSDGTLELSFFEGLPQGAVEILKLLLDKIKIGRIIDRLRDRENDDSQPGQGDQGDGKPDGDAEQED